MTIIATYKFNLFFCNAQNSLGEGLCRIAPNPRSSNSAAASVPCRSRGALDGVGRKESVPVAIKLPGRTPSDLYAYLATRVRAKSEGARTDLSTTLQVELLSNFPPTPQAMLFYTIIADVSFGLLPVLHRGRSHAGSVVPAKNRSIVKSHFLCYLINL